MLNMSFYDGTLKTEKLNSFIRETNKPIYFTYGLKYRKPNLVDSLVSKEKALEIVLTHSLLDAEEKEDGLYLNAYSANDLF